MILECTLETELLIDLLINDDSSQLVFKLAREKALAMQTQTLQPNNRATEYFGLDGALINRICPVLESRFAGIRIAFCLDVPILADGHLFPRQQIQICLWNCQVIREPRKYIGSSFLVL